MFTTKYAASTGSRTARSSCWSTSTDSRTRCPIPQGTGFRGQGRRARRGRRLYRRDRNARRRHRRSPRALRPRRPHSFHFPATLTLERKPHGRLLHANRHRAPLPLADTTPLERLVLGAIFETDKTEDGVSRFAPDSVNDYPFAADRPFARRLGPGERYAVPAS